MMESKTDIIIKILNEIPFINKKPYSHNIISLNLMILERDYGEEEVINLIKTTKLKNLGWGHILKKN